MRKIHANTALLLTAVYLALALGTAAAHHHHDGAEPLHAASLRGLATAAQSAQRANTTPAPLAPLATAGEVEAFCPACWLEQHAQPTFTPQPLFFMPTFPAAPTPAALFSSLTFTADRLPAADYPARAPPARTC